MSTKPNGFNVIKKFGRTGTKKICKPSGWQERILGAEINDLEIKKPYEEWRNPRTGSLRR